MRIIIYWIFYCLLPIAARIQLYDYFENKEAACATTMTTTMSWSLHLFITIIMRCRPAWIKSKIRTNTFALQPILITYIHMWCDVVKKHKSVVRLQLRERMHVRFNKYTAATAQHTLQCEREFLININSLLSSLVMKWWSNNAIYANTINMQSRANANVPQVMRKIP